MKWRVEARVEDNQGEIHKFASVESEKSDALLARTKFVREFYKTCWSNNVIDGKTYTATVYTDGMGVIGFANIWAEE